MLTLFETSAPILHRLVAQHLEGHALPQAIVAADGTLMPLIEWLESLRYDRSPFAFDLAARFGLMASPALTCEAALSLRDRILERTAALDATELAEPDAYPPLPSAVSRPSSSN